VKVIKRYKICTRCIMDETVSDIKFDENGVCNYCTEYFDEINKLNLNELQKEDLLKKVLREIKKEGKNKDYDCILGVSGGLDSSYLLYHAVKLGLKPLAVHLDNGWDSELSISNIEKLVKTLNVDLYTHVIDWEEFKDLEIAFIKANVIDIEMLTDHAIIATLYKTAFDRKIKYILAGTNVASEGMRMPPGWIHLKLDLRNIKAISKKYGNEKKLKTFPMIGLAKYLKYRFIDGIKWVSLLNYLTYNRDEAIQIMNQEIGWRNYERKHYESLFTRFYQGYILPKKFNVDKRKLHYSTLICSGQMTRDEAYKLMENDPYSDEQILKEDKEYVLKKLGLTNEEFEKYIDSPSVPHSYYPSNEWMYNQLTKQFLIVKKLIGVISTAFKRKFVFLIF